MIRLIVQYEKDSEREDAEDYLEFIQRNVTGLVHENISKKFIIGEK